MSPHDAELTSIWWEFGDLTIPAPGWTEDGPKLVGYWAVQLRQVGEGNAGVLYFMEGSHEVVLNPITEDLIKLQLVAAHAIVGTVDTVPLLTLVDAVLVALDRFEADGGALERIVPIRAHLIETKAQLVLRASNR